MQNDMNNGAKADAKADAKAEDIAKDYEEKFGVSCRIKTFKSIGYEQKRIWVDIEKDKLELAISHLFSYSTPHFVMLTSQDLGKEIELIYHFKLFWGKKNAIIPVNLCVKIDKSENKIGTITRLVPAAEFGEREAQDMIGIDIEGASKAKIEMPEELDMHPFRIEDEEVEIKEEKIVEGDKAPKEPVDLEKSEGKEVEKTKGELDSNIEARTERDEISNIAKKIKHNIPDESAN